MSHNAEIIAVGTELLQGSIANTNAQMVSRVLCDLGFSVCWHTSVGDRPEQLREVLNVARNRADLIITIGGLGPTFDDLTKETICEAFHRELVLHEDLLEEIRSYYRDVVHIEMPDNNIHQALMPTDSTVLENPVGTAPGCAFACDGVHVLMLPGPPHECEAVLMKDAIPYLKTLSGQVIVAHDIMTFGMGESSVENLLHDRMCAMVNPSLATYAKPAEVRLRASARAESPEEAEQMLAPVVQEVCDALGDVVFGVDVPSLVHVCMDLLEERGWTFATAESCSGGQIAAKITALPGASKVYRGGVVSYWNSVKADVLGVPQETLEEQGPVSEAVARAMAEGARRCTGAEIAVGVTGVAGPEPDERGNPVGLVYIGLATPDGTFSHQLNTGYRRRDRVQELAVNYAFDMIRRYLSGLPVAAQNMTHP